MGIKGLTKYINDRSHLYFEDVNLHDCDLIIDGHSISCQLFNWKPWQFDFKSVKCYGGDYDKYAHVVDYFFTMLDQANITPYVIFDGGYEQRKLPTILSRMQKTICTADQLNPDVERTRPNKTIFPLFLREVFKDVIRNRDIKLAMCKFEGDLEIASIAKMLNCPVLTSDSDYYLFGCQYIPFTTFGSKAIIVDNRRSGRSNSSLTASFTW
ncbi:hypothetical protein GWI33_017558 [Rhynchophorus ferrugineus]|uniref:XPG N-terminal domain-containing protein n=1 Tax=Rhynchophorus ferrugineus TaxID=354439 RepID=A0A834HYF6_RHYFE|nr:hypothetical protein GWI33_017558 [Rhynchophorus ferrugineus]